MNLNLNRIFVIVAFLTAFSAVAQGPQEKRTQFTVVDRDSQGRATYPSVELPELLNRDYAETRDFKIVQKKETSPLKWADLSEEDRLRAANLLYHLTEAKKYFVETLQSEEVKRLEQVVVRINISNFWNKDGHFSNDSYNPQFNNAHSIPAGVGLASHGVVPWGREIWFRPLKEISTREILNHLSKDPLDPGIEDARKLLYPAELTMAGAEVSRYLFLPQYSGDLFISSMTRQAGTLVALEGAFVLLKKLNRLLVPSTYYLDTSMVPEIIDHEFSHIALSDYMNPTEATPVVEGMADYFAATIAKTPKLAQKIKEYSRGKGKDGSKTESFDVAYESKAKATSDFVLRTLWGMHEVIGTELTTRLVWETRKNLDTYHSDIRNDLIGGLLDACSRICPNPDSQRLKLNVYFNSLKI